ncbi:hypothetical protein TorRG33x02_030610 [Trema orientale]|uniref:Uncharacterized protein n=1 Tax=Trema orientale TaxID=63057 RepID=A0A2P5FU61_TREOI|nr:hypothetical protein TorRG33x02_030610 [Trema orientale]
MASTLGSREFFFMSLSIWRLRLWFSPNRV